MNASKNHRKRITLEDLAAMTARGFLAMEEKMATKEDIAELKQRLDRIESHNERRLDLLENRTIVLKNTMEGELGVKIAW